jgi:multidrug efflux pump subunit AcrB
VLVAACVLPIAVVFTLAAIVRAGLRLDLMTLGGIAIAIGLIVDEAIVVIESIGRALEARPAANRQTVIAEAVRRIAKPLAASTAANVVVFAPLAFLSGIPGFFFRALAITLTIALAISIVLSLVVAPGLASALGARARRSASPRFLERIYLTVLRWILRRAILVYAGALAAVAVSAALLFHSPTDFLPQVDEGQFEIKYALPPGMSLTAADALATTFERAILLDQRVDHVARLSGVDTNGYLATPPDAGTLRVTLKPATQRDPFDPIADHLRDEVRYVDPYAAIEVHQLLEDQINDLSGAPEPVQLTVAGPDQERLTKIAAKLADDIVDIHGIVDTFDGVTFEARTRRVYPPHDGPDTVVTFSDDVRARIDGIDAGSIADADGAIPIIVKTVGNGPLEKHVRLGPPELNSTVEEENGRRIVRVTAGIENADLSTVTAAIERRTAHDVAALPPGYTVTIGGASAEQRQAFTEFATILAIALVLVFGVLVATFDSFRLPLVVLAAVPLTPIGVALALVVTKTPLNVASFMGILLLVGIVVRNGILLVESANRRVRDGANAAEAMEAAAAERLRPILMTTVATLGALAPLAFGFGAGSELERPLAVAVIGGIVTSTALTLAIVPVLYVAISRGTSPDAAERASA